MTKSRPNQIETKRQLRSNRQATPIDNRPNANANTVASMPTVDVASTSAAANQMDELYEYESDTVQETQLHNSNSKANPSESANLSKSQTNTNVAKNTATTVTNSPTNIQMPQPVLTQQQPFFNFSPNQPFQFTIYQPPVFNLEKYDGSTDIKSFIKDFRAAAIVSRWAPIDQVNLLSAHLTGMLSTHLKHLTTNRILIMF